MSSYSTIKLWWLSSTYLSHRTSNIFCKTEGFSFPNVNFSFSIAKIVDTLFEGLYFLSWFLGFMIAVHKEAFKQRGPSGEYEIISSKCQKNIILSKCIAMEYLFHRFRLICSDHCNQNYVVFSPECDPSN